MDTCVCMCCPLYIRTYGSVYCWCSPWLWGAGPLVQLAVGRGTHGEGRGEALYTQGCVYVRIVYGVVSQLSFMIQPIGSVC